MESKSHVQEVHQPRLSSKAYSQCIFEHQNYLGSYLMIRCIINKVVKDTSLPHLNRINLIHLVLTYVNIEMLNMKIIKEFIISPLSLICYILIHMNE